MAKPKVIVTWEELEIKSYPEKEYWLVRDRVFANVARFTEWLLDEMNRDVPWRNVRVNGETINL